jgi:hypothetical protein
MNEYLIAAASILVVLSGSAERFVEVIKGFIPPLNVSSSNPKIESRRKAYVQLLSIACCLITAYLARNQIAEALWGANQPVKWQVVTGLGVLAAGGSSLWNSVLTYLVGIKDIKKVEATTRKDQALQQGPLTSHPDLPASMPSPSSHTS